MKSIKNLMQILMLLSAPLILQSCQSLADVIAIGNSANDQIKDLNDPTDAQDAVTKAYVDNTLEAFGLILPDNYAGTVTDIDGNTYMTVKIGTQTWMAENLRVGRYRTGNPIPLIKDNATWSSLAEPGYCWYENSLTYKTTYGVLYNWHTIVTDSVCPVGWDVPTDAEWQTLINYLGGASVAGGKLKEVGTKHWTSPNTGATNETGFMALPGGYRYYDGVSKFIGESSNWWSSTEHSPTEAYGWGDLVYSNRDIHKFTFSKNAGLSIRCLKE
jgi:uncharacterized protein (TIGR02145 family)